MGFGFFFCIYHIVHIVLGGSVQELPKRRDCKAKNLLIESVRECFLVRHLAIARVQLAIVNVTNLTQSDPNYFKEVEDE